MDIDVIRTRAAKCKTFKTLDSKRPNWLQQPLPVQKKIVSCQLTSLLVQGRAAELFRFTPAALDNQTVYQSREQGIRSARIVLQQKLNELSEQQIKHSQTDVSPEQYEKQKQAANIKLARMSIEEFALAQPLFCQPNRKPALSSYFI